MFYFEQWWPTNSEWRPATTDSRPVVKKGRMVRGGGTGPKVRAIKPVPPQYQHLTLVQLHAVLSPDGAFTPPAIRAQA
jgi:hypothetical protein